MSTLESQLKEAFRPLGERAKRRLARIEELRKQPDSEQKNKAIVAEQREIELVKAVSSATVTIFRQLQDQLVKTERRADRLKDQLVPLVDEAAHYEHLFHHTLDRLVPDPPDERVPPLVIHGYQSILKMLHLRQTPHTYAATYGLLPAPHA